MRDLLDTLDIIILSEGVGLSNRKPGETFKNSSGEILTFKSLDYYPDKGGKYETEDELDAAVDDALAGLKLNFNQINWSNQKTARMGGFGLALFTNDNNQPFWVGRWFQQVSPNRVQNNFPHNAIPGGFTYQSRVGQKENTGYKPSEILTSFQNLKPGDIAQQIYAKFGEDSDEGRAMKIFMSNNIPMRIPRGNMNPEAFRDYFCEMLQPMALIMGKNVQGNAQEASDIFFGGSGYGDCTISFNTNTIGGLYDSLLVNPEGKQIKISSKGKDGASASVTNLIKSVNELKNAPAGAKLIKTHLDSIRVLDTIQKLGHFGAPLKLAQDIDMITAQEAEQVMNLKPLGPEDQIIGAGILSDKLEKLYQGRKARDPSRIIPIEHMIAAIAYPVANHINANTNFGQAAADILNHSALVQMYTNTSNSDEYIVIDNFTAIYPSQTVTGVVLDATKVYFSTGGKGNYTFTILKNGAKPKDVSPADPVVKESVQTLGRKRRR